MNEREEINEERVKKKSLTGSLIKAGVVTLGIITGISALYKIDQTEQAVITQFGKPVKVILNHIEEAWGDEVKETYEKEELSIDEGPGLKVKLPFIQNVRRYDRRLLRWNGYPEEIPTKDKKYIWIDATARWYIKDPLKFLRTVGTEEQAHARLDDIIDAATRNAITKMDLIEIVRTDNRGMQVAEEELRETIKVGKVYEGRPKIVKEITETSRENCREYGIDIHSEGILIKGLTYVESVKEKVEDRMIAERKRIAERYLSEGQGEYERIQGMKEKDVKEIRSEAYKTARKIEGEADRKAVKIYADAYNKDTYFYRFIKTLEVYEKSLSGSRLIIGTDNPLLELMKGTTRDTTKYGNNQE